MATIDTGGRSAAARDFILREGRVLERRLFATLFEGAPADGVIAALLGYRNADGGFGHGLEPDKLCPESLPIDVEQALLAMDAAGRVDRELARGACAFLASMAVDGAVPLATRAIEAYPRAEHWSDWTYKPSLNPTAGLAGLLYRLGIDHPWRGADIAARIEPHLESVAYLRLDPLDPSYGMTPLHYAPHPASRWRALFADAMIEGHLDRLEADQQSDGGWALGWEPPSRAATLAYRAMETLRALRVLTAYGRTGP
jgi:hypothetical protein